MNKLGVMLVLVILVMGFASALLCNEQTDIDDIPCLGLTKILSCPTSNTNITVLNLNTTARYNLSTTAIGDGTYNFTFNFTQASYSLIDCQNSTAQLVVGDFEGDNLWKFAVILGMIGAAFIVSLTGRFVFENNNWLIKSSMYITSILIFIIAIQTALLISPNANIINIMNTTSMATIIITIMLFLYLTILFVTNAVKAFRDVKKEKKSEI